MGNSVLVLILVAVFVVSLIIKPAEPVSEQPALLIPPGASVEYIAEQSFKNSDNRSCELIEDEQEKIKCFEMVEDRIQLEESLEEVEQELVTSSTNDKKLLGKAMISKDESLCEQIVDDATRQKCFDLI